MKTNYELVKIGKLLKDEYILDLQDGNHGEMHPKSIDYVESGVPFVMANNVNNHTVDLDGAFKISKDTADKLRIGFAKNGDVLLTHKGTIGNTAIVENADPYIMLTPQVTYYRVNDAKLNNYYLLYCFDDPFFQKTIISLAQQSTRPYIGITAQKRLLIRLRKIDNQLKIVSILKLFDDLLNANRRRIQLLEKAARLLFREWFVYFRFPGYEKVKIVDGLPEGWKKGNIHDISEVKSGYAFNSKDWLDEGNPVIKIGNIIGDGTINLDDCSYIDQNVASKAKSFILKKGDLLIAMTGATIGKVGLLSENEKIAYLYQRVGKFIPKFEGAELILYCFFMGNTAQNYITNYAGGAAQANISASQIESIKTLVAPQNIYNQFISLIEPMFEENLNLRSQNQKLAQARDLLLPRLMSGEIEV